MDEELQALSKAGYRMAAASRSTNGTSLFVFERCVGA